MEGPIDTAQLCGECCFTPAVPVLQIIGYKNSGKTTLSCKLIAALTAGGLRVGSAKHDAHEFQLDDSGTDSERHLSHGAVETVLTSSTATRTMRRSPSSLEDIAGQLAGRVDILIAEGFKSAHYPKIALIRHARNMEALLAQADDIRLWVSWEKESVSTTTTAPILLFRHEDAVLEAAVSLARSLL